MMNVSRRLFLSISKKITFSLLYCWLIPPYLFGNKIDRSSLQNVKEKNGILVLYASFHGSTAQMAEFMGQKLNMKGIAASVKSIHDEIDFSSYTGIIMGSPIHRGQWMKEAVEFVNTRRVEFGNRLIACFYTCMSKAKHPPTEKTLSELAAYKAAMTALIPTIPPSRIGSFAGMLDYNKCSFFTKLFMWLIMNKNDLEAGDYRDWKAIESWLDEIIQTQF